MYSFKKSLVALVGLLVIVGALAILMPLVSRGQGNNGPQVRDVDNPALQPFQQPLVANQVIFVPQGKRLVIEYVSGDASNSTVSTACRLVSVFVQTTVQEQTALHHVIPIQTASITGFAFYVFGQETRLYADPGTGVALRRSTTSGTPCEPAVSGTISGYFVDVP
jgi:hypothetical protein